MNKATQQTGLFEPSRHGFVLLQDHRPPGNGRFYEYRNNSQVNGQHDYRRLNLYLSKDGDFVTIWFGLLEKVLVESLFRDHGLEPVAYDEALFRGYIESVEQANHILKALQPESVLPQLLSVDPKKGILCELVKKDEAGEGETKARDGRYLAVVWSWFCRVHTFTGQIPHRVLLPLMFFVWMTFGVCIWDCF